MTGKKFCLFCRKRLQRLLPTGKVGFSRFFCEKCMLMWEFTLPPLRKSLRENNHALFGTIKFYTVKSVPYTTVWKTPT